MNVISLILIILGLACVAMSVWLMIESKKAGWLLATLVGVGIIFFADSFTFVPTGYVGVRTSFGQISNKPVKSGANFHTPFVERIHKINCKQLEKDFGSLQIWSETSERTEVYCENVVVDYQINSEYAAWIWQNVEEWDTNLVKQTSIESGIKAATKQFNDTDVTDRSKIEGAAKEAIQKSLNIKYGNQIVNIVSVTIGNINFSDAYNEAVEKKAQAKLAAETAEFANKQVTQQVQAEAEQKKIDAEAEAEAKRIKAEGEAEAIRIKADAEAEANEKIAKSLTPELIEKERIDKWNGEVPLVTGSGGNIISLDGLIEKPEK